MESVNLVRPEGVARGGLQETTGQGDRGAAGAAAGGPKSQKKLALTPPKQKAPGTSPTVAIILQGVSRSTTPARARSAMLLEPGRGKRYGFACASWEVGMTHPDSDPA